MLHGRNQVLQIIADHALESNFNAQLVDLPGEKKRVCIHAEGSQQLGAYRNDLSVHG
jgi:hypothetical protein